mgnify:CR=1 FL=1
MEKDADCFATHLRDEFPLDRLFRYQTNRPAGMSFRGLATHHGDDALLRGSIQQGCCAWPLLIIQRTIQATAPITMADPAHGLRSELDQLGNPLSRDTLAELQKSQRTKDYANLLNATTQELAKSRLVRAADGNPELGPCHT